MREPFGSRTPFARLPELPLPLETRVTGRARVISAFAVERHGARLRCFYPYVMKRMKFSHLLMLPLAGLSFGMLVGDCRAETVAPQEVTAAAQPSLNKALLEAAGKGDVEAIGRLLEQGADVQAQSENGSSPLHMAVWEGHADAVRRLLAAGADVKAKAGNGSTPLHWAAQRGNAEVASLLLAAGADVSATDLWGWCPLHAASEKGHADVVRLLLEAGADVNATNDAGVTPLRRATLYARPEAAALLRAHGGKE